jgi:hypothetical protein
VLPRRIPYDGTCRFPKLCILDRSIDHGDVKLSGRP